MAKILIPGVGNAQTDFIAFCKNFGFETHTCSYKNTGRGIQHSDFFSVIDIVDYESIADYAKKNKIDLIYTVGSDIAMPTISKVSALLGLPSFVSPETAIICNNKNLLRAKLESIDEFSIKYKELKKNTDFDGWGIFPCILKPADSQGQRGISILNERNDFEKAFNLALANSKSKTAIVEEIVEGPEFSANIYVIDKQIKFTFLTRRNSFKEFPGGIIKSHEYPLNIKIDESKLKSLFHQSINALNIANGPVYYQCKIDKNNNPKIIEITPRLDGCHLWRLIYVVTGINLFEIIIKHLTGVKITDNMLNSNESKYNHNKLTLDFFTLPPGFVMDYTSQKPVDNPIYIEWYYQKGEIISKINGFAEKVGYQIFAE